jgi:hypothetical protein
VVHVLTATTTPKRAVAGGGSGSTRSGEQRHPIAHLLTEGPVSGGPTNGGSFIKREPIELTSNLVHLDSSFIKREPIELRSNLV